jgi:hypothetical protein
MTLSERRVTEDYKRRESNLKSRAYALATYQRTLRSAREERS